MIIDRPIKVAILDLYDGIPNQGIIAFEKILKNFSTEYRLELQVNIFNVRGGNNVPDIDHDIYLSSGGPGDPLASEGTEWDNSYFKLIDRLHKNNTKAGTQKKYVLFVCHSFQLMCRHWQLGEVNLRNSPSYGVVPVHLTHDADNEPLLDQLNDPFFALDSRSWQVIDPDMERFGRTGAKLVAIEQERSEAGLPRAMMAIRFSPYFFGTQFHPEADADILIDHLSTDLKCLELIQERGEAGYSALINDLQDPDKIRYTQSKLIPHFLQQAGGLS